MNGMMVNDNAAIINVGPTKYVERSVRRARRVAAECSVESNLHDRNEYNVPQHLRKTIGGADFILFEGLGQRSNEKSGLPKFG